MRKEEVEIFSDATNQPVIKHPGRNYPGVLLQGDSLYSLCKSLDAACADLKNKDIEAAFEEVNEIRNSLWEKLNHYKAVLNEHNIQLPFNEVP